MKEEKTHFGTVEYHENIAVGIVNAGVDFGKECVDTLIEGLNRNFQDKPFIYISNRVNDYSLNPAETRRLELETNMIGAAFVLVRRFSFDSFQTEKVFYRIPTHACTSKEDAMNWAHKILNKQH